MRNHATTFVIFTKEISEELRKEATGFAGFNCSMCGLAPGELDLATGQRAYLRVGYLDAKRADRREVLSNLQAVCSICSEGRSEITPIRPSAIWLLSQVRRSGIIEQKAVLAWLRKKFKE